VDAVEAARKHVAASGGRPLKPLPEAFEQTRISLHTVAEQLLKPKRVLETGSEISLRFTHDGFGSAPWKAGEASGKPGQVRIEMNELVVTEDGHERRVNAGDMQNGAKLLGISAPSGTPAELPVDRAAAAALADWYAYGTVVLALLIERCPGPDAEPIRLWPEHFDVATVIGDEGAGSRANFGGSPGDEEHHEPYLYVGPWRQQPEGPVWNATAFHGAELAYAELLATEDQVETGVEFLVRHLQALGS
jgi:hypothetical protein